MNPPEEPPGNPEASENTTIKKNVSPEVLQLLTKHYTDQFWSTLAKTSVILLGWIAALTLMFVDPIFPLYTEASRQTNILADIERQKDAARIKSVSSARKSTSTAVPTPALPPADGQPGQGQTPVAEQPEGEATAQAARTTPSLPPTARRSPTPSPSPTVAPLAVADPVAALQERKQEAIEQFSKLRTPLGELNIRIIFAPLIWSLFFAALLGFFLQRRLLLIGTLAKIVELRRMSHTDRLTGLGSWTPFWLAPLPQPSGDTTLDEATLREYLGWGTTERWRSLLTKTCIGVALCAHLYVAVTTAFLVRTYRDPSQALAVFLAVVGSFICCLLASIIWLRPRVELESFPVGFVQMDKRRRRFLAAGFSLAGFGLLLALITALVPTGILKGLMVRLSGSTVPRFRRRPRPPMLYGYENSFHRNIYSYRIHYFGQRGLTSNREFLSRENLTKVDLSQVFAALMPPNNTSFANLNAPPSWPAMTDTWGRSKTPRLIPSQASPLIECLALERWQTDPKGALDLLRVAILFDSQFKFGIGKRPSYRLYDLYAGLAFKMKNSPAIDDLVRYAQTRWKDDTRMTKRIQTWQTPTAAYISRWSSENLQWKIGLPRDKSHYNGRCSVG